MRKYFKLVSVAAFIFTSVYPVWSADLVSGTYSSAAKTRSRYGQHLSAKPMPWVPPRNSFVIVPARYCEDNACEPVTLRIWSGDRFVMNRLGPHEEQVRIANIDAADVIARCPTEATAAQDAKMRLVSILSGSTFLLARVSGEKDHTSTAFVTANGKDIGKRLMDLRYARPLERPARLWC